MILLATNKRDLTTDFIVLELRRRGLDFVRLNTEDLASASVIFRPQEEWSFAIGERRFSLGEVEAGYYRRPERPDPPTVLTNEAAAEYAVAEWSAILRSLWNALEGRWLNSPFAILRAEDKPRQLAEAQAVGLSIPETLITNDFEEAAAFLGEAPSVGKPLRRALIDDGETGEVLFTSRIQPLGLNDRASVEVAPVILQREIGKYCDVRATVVGDQVFAAAIRSQERPETEVDWRYGSRPDLAHDIIDLPPDVISKIVELTSRLGLRFGAVDLIQDRDGRFWFLEINPNGQWAWIERRTGLPISSAIVDILKAVR